MATDKHGMAVHWERKSFPGKAICDRGGDKNVPLFTKSPVCITCDVCTLRLVREAQANGVDVCDTAAFSTFIKNGVW